MLMVMVLEMFVLVTQIVILSLIIRYYSLIFFLVQNCLSHICRHSGTLSQIPHLGTCGNTECMCDCHNNDY